MKARLYQNFTLLLGEIASLEQQSELFDSDVNNPCLGIFVCLFNSEHYTIIYCCTINLRKTKSLALFHHLRRKCWSQESCASTGWSKSMPLYRWEHPNCLLRYFFFQIYHVIRNTARSVKIIFFKWISFPFLMFFFPTMLWQENHQIWNAKKLYWESKARMLDIYLESSKDWQCFMKCNTSISKFWKGHFGIILGDNMSKKLELGMNWLIGGGRFRSSADTNSGLSKDESVFNDFTQSKWTRAHGRGHTKLIFVFVAEDILTFQVSLILKFLIKYLIRTLTPGDNSPSSHRRLRDWVDLCNFHSPP